MYIKQLTNEERATIQFTDDTNHEQPGYLSYTHLNANSNSAASSFHFNTSEAGIAVIIDKTGTNAGFYVGTTRCLLTTDSILTITDEIKLEGASGNDGKIQKNEATGRDEMQLYSGGDAYSTGSVGSGIHLYGNSDSEHSGDIAFLTGSNGNGNARMIIAGGGGPNSRTETDTHITIGNEGTDIAGSGQTNIWDFVDGEHDKTRGMLNLINPDGYPALYLAGANSTEGDIAIATGEVFHMGHWDHSGSGTFTLRFSINTSGNYNFTGSNTSDRTVKENIQTVTGTSIDKIIQLTPKTFNFIGSDIPHTGFIAQEVKEILPSLVNGPEGEMGLDFNGITAHLVNCVKELKAENDSLKARIESLESS